MKKVIVFVALFVATIAFASEAETNTTEANTTVAE